MITNGYLLMPDRIARLNRAGLDHMQISIDNVMPDAVSKKSLKVLDAKLRMLAEHADFHVNINSVVGGGIANPTDALTVSERALELGFSSTIGIIHDGSGQLKPLGKAERTVWDKVRRLTRRNYSRFNQFQEAIANGQPNDWRCRAGARYLYICEFGLVHYCSQQRGYPGVPLAQYGRADLRREFLTQKSCAPNCTISCVHQVSYIDHWRAPADLSCDSRRRTWRQLGGRYRSGADSLIFATPLGQPPASRNSFSALVLQAVRNLLEAFIRALEALIYASKRLNNLP